MADVVDSDELLRRIQRARAWAEREEETWKARSDDLRRGDPGGSRDADVRSQAYEAVRKVLDEILTPGVHATDG
ncbi:hypothetical protein FHS35_001096 [Streptomyces umbrinus]|jgi:hypothetical protein|uniref:hypothetical protein n=1 Tax=Streptomyces umbrinus TaxID=67370 RepID=UPI00167CBE6F|nr:hypothetical protein [Streptomyces umbrinus]MCR3724248.1 hypothetical protein [Streptomyces umbrinus]GHH52209.1 hypothetical protein GCM10018775_52290 [Streptomyces umbrinus]